MTALRPALVLFVILSLITGLAYPFLMTGIGQLVFPDKANGSLIARDGKVVGSELIGQAFSDPKYFWGRLSATSPMPYNATASSGSNLGPTNPALLDNAKARIEALKAADAGNTRRFRSIWLPRPAAGSIPTSARPPLNTRSGASPRRAA